MDDPIYAEALQFVLDNGKVSISLIQRRLRIGFNRAARFIEQMEKDGLLSQADGTRPRSVVHRSPAFRQADRGTQRRHTGHVA